MMKKFILLLLLAALSDYGFAWIYPEHRDIAILAIQKLDPAHRADLERFWSIARNGHESRLFSLSIDTTRSRGPEFIDFAAWPAISGDHSTSAANLLHNVLQTEWIMKVANVAYELRKGIANARNRSDRLNKLRDSDIKLLRVDPEYVTRAGSNNVHFLLARPNEKTTESQYFAICFRQGTEMNALGTYGWFHLSALLKAEKFARDSMSSGERSSLMLAILADEAFAIHFLEDMYASGHVAGTWGNAAQRKGTHDYYNEKGLEVSTWDGGRMVLMGDAYMRPEDADRSSDAVRISLEQVIEVASGRRPFTFITHENLSLTADTLNVCKTNFMPFRQIDSTFSIWYRAVIMPTAVPGLASGLGELPRFRAEVGPFIGLTAAVRGSVLFSGFGTHQNTAGVTAGLGMAVRVGLGLEGVLNEAGDGLVFLDLGWRLDGPSSMKMTADPALKQFGAMFSAVPSRDAFYARLRLPFYVIPGDLLILGPILYLFAPETMNKVLTSAGNGGLIPWQSGMVTPIGRFQFILGREVGVYLYGWPKDPDRYLLPKGPDLDADQVLVSMRSTLLEFPFLEYRPFHAFSTNQTASLVLQFFGGFDIPGKARVIYPETEIAPKVRTITFLGVRIGFDWRYYFSKKKS